MRVVVGLTEKKAKNKVKVFFVCIDLKKFKFSISKWNIFVNHAFFAYE